MSRVTALFYSCAKLDGNWNLAKCLIHADNHFSEFSCRIKYYRKWVSMETRWSYYDVRAEPLPVRKTRSIGQPQLMSTKSMFPAHSFAMISAVGTIVAGLLPAICTPKMDSEGWRRTNDHSSLDPARNEVASPTKQKKNKNCAIRQPQLTDFHHK